MKTTILILAPAVGALLLACSQDDKSSGAGGSDSGGAAGEATAVGGRAGSGGSKAATTKTTGGTWSTGGSSALGGSETSAGTTAMGGMTLGTTALGQGGSSVAGGSAAMGGTSAVGTSVGGTTATGQGGMGTTTTGQGGASAVGGTTAAGGTAAGGTSGSLPLLVSVAPGGAPGSALIQLLGTSLATTNAVTKYEVTAEPSGIKTQATTLPITLTGLQAKTPYTYTVLVTYSGGITETVTTGLLGFYDVVETFYEPMTQPNDSIFTGTFTFDLTHKAVTNLTGSLTQSMTKVGGVYASPMTTVPLSYQLSSVPVELGGSGGFLVTSFALPTTNTFTGGGFAPGGTQYYGLQEGTPNNHNAYAMIFVNATEPTTMLVQAQLDKLAYADCTAGGMMMSSCMTGTTIAGYGRKGTMGGYPISETITAR